MSKFTTKKLKELIVTSLLKEPGAQRQLVDRLEEAGIENNLPDDTCLTLITDMEDQKILMFGFNCD